MLSPVEANLSLRQRDFNGRYGYRVTREEVCILNTWLFINYFHVNAVHDASIAFMVIEDPFAFVRRVDKKRPSSYLIEDSFWS